MQPAGGDHARKTARCDTSATSPLPPSAVPLGLSRGKTLVEARGSLLEELTEVRLLGTEQVEKGRWIWKARRT